jgi:hypothetical protein
LPPHSFQAGGKEAMWKLPKASLKTTTACSRAAACCGPSASFGAENPAVIDRPVERAMLDFELASTLLTLKVAEIGTPIWNANLQKYAVRGE